MDDDKELDKVLRDAVKFGTGYSVNGKHVPAHEVKIQLDPNDVKELIEEDGDINYRLALGLMLANIEDELHESTDDAIMYLFN